MVLAAIVQFTGNRGYAPTWHEIGTATGLNSTSSVGYHIRALTADGLLRSNHLSGFRTTALAEGVAVSRNGLVARAVAVSHCPHCLLSLPTDHACTQSRPEENRHA